MKQENNKIKYLLYVRKSTESEDRQILSIESQINEMKKMAQKERLKIIAIKIEAKSAKAPGRPIFNEALDNIENEEANGLIVWNPDRLSRNSVDTGRLIYLFDLGKLLEVVTPAQVFRNTPNDKFLLNLLCSQAKLENDNKSLNVKRGLKTKAEKGLYPGPAPTGYINDKYAEKGNKKIKIDPDRFNLIRKMFDLMLTGNYTPPKILKIANEEWGFRTSKNKPLARSTIYYIFTRSFYYGMFEYPRGSGNWYKGTHKKMISEEEYDKIQILLGRKGKPRPKKHIFAFTGLIRCGECGAMITAEEKIKYQKNGNIHHYVYYHCTKKKDPNCSQGSIRKENLEAQIVKVLDSIIIPPEIHDFALKWFKNENQKEVSSRNTILKSRQKAYRAILKRIDGLIDMRADQEITDVEFKQKKSVLLKEKNRLEKALLDTERRVDRWLEIVDEAFIFARDAKYEFENGGFEKKREIFSKLGSNLILKEKKLEIDLKNTLMPMRAVSEEEKRLEPLKIGKNKLEIEKIYSQSPRLLRR